MINIYIRIQIYFLGNTNAQRWDFNIDVICIGRARIENEPARALKLRKTTN